MVKLMIPSKIVIYCDITTGTYYIGEPGTDTYKEITIEEAIRLLKGDSDDRDLL